MGKKLAAIYAAIKQETGATGQMRLTMMTGLIAPKATSAPDTPELVLKFTNAYKEITGKDCPPEILQEEDTNE